MVNLKAVIVQMIVLLIIVIFISYGIAALKNSEINSLREEIHATDLALDTLTDEKNSISAQYNTLKKQFDDLNDDLVGIDYEQIKEFNKLDGRWELTEGDAGFHFETMQFHDRWQQQFHKPVDLKIGWTDITAFSRKSDNNKITFEIGGESGMDFYLDYYVYPQSFSYTFLDDDHLWIVAISPDRIAHANYTRAGI